MEPTRESASNPEYTDKLRLTATYCAVELGWRLVPLEKGSKVITNEAIIADRKWGPFRERPTTEKDIQTWIDIDPGLSIAAITGPCSGNLVCVDVDKLENWPSTLPVPPSPQVETPRGFRCFYKASRPLEYATVFKWGEILCGGLAILPPSIHPNGQAYRWSGYLAPWETPVEWLPDAYYPLCEKAKPKLAVVNGRNLPRPPLPGSKIDGDSLRSYYSDPQTVAKIAAFLSVRNFVPGRAFRCILPGHEESTPSASIYQSDNGIFVYHDWHQREGIEFITLPEVRATFGYGHMKMLRESKPEAATWGIRLLVESGVIDPVPVDRILLPPDAPLSARKIAKGFQELLSCRWLYTPGDPAPFSRRFASAWCNMGEVQAGEGLKYLRESGFLKVVDRCRSIPLYELKDAA